MPNTPVWLLPYPLETAVADVPVDIQALATRLEAVLTMLKSAGAIPGEVKLWSGSTVPNPATFGHWVWADGAPYSSATYPISSGNIDPAWKTHGGKADPGAGQFRVPDLRGQTPVGMDKMPGGARANRITRAAAAVLAGVSGEELHTLLTAELAVHGHAVSDPPHGHGVSDPTHGHGINDPTHNHAMPWNDRGSGAINTTGKGLNYLVGEQLGTYGAATGVTVAAGPTGVTVVAAPTGVTVGQSGGGAAHENLQPVTFVPYIVKLDD